ITGEDDQRIARHPLSFERNENAPHGLVQRVDHGRKDLPILRLHAGVLRHQFRGRLKRSMNRIESRIEEQRLLAFPLTNYAYRLRREQVRRVTALAHALTIALPVQPALARVFVIIDLRVHEAVEAVESTGMRKHAPMGMSEMPLSNHCCLIAEPL